MGMTGFEPCDLSVINRLLSPLSYTPEEVSVFKDPFAFAKARRGKVRAEPSLPNHHFIIAPFRRAVKGGLPYLFRRKKKLGVLT